MRYQALMRAAAVVLSAAALAGGYAVAQSPPQPSPSAEAKVMSDMEPLPAEDRSSVGAVILMDEPVLAQREALQEALARSEPDTRAMGAASRDLQKQLMQQPAESPKEAQQPEEPQQKRPAR